MSALLVTCFTVSGATSLILQVVWARQLTEVFGSSSLAIATVLATFMAGLALGARLGGRMADRLVARSGGRLASPLGGYAVAEAVVGAAALLLPLVFHGYRELGPPLWRALPDQPILLALARTALTALALIVPTTAMGATLPLLGRHVTRRRGDLGAAGRRLGALYASNTAGALLGAAAAGFWLIPAIGVTATSRVAAFGALGLAAAVALAARLTRTPDHEPEPDHEPDHEHEPAHEPTGLPLRLLLFAYAASGAVAMALEVFFSRALGIVLGSSVYSFTLVLVVFLAGLSLGAALAARPAARMRRPELALGLLFFALAGAVLFSHLLLDELPAIMVAMLSGTTLKVSTLLGIHLALAGVVIVPVAVGLGAVLPLVMRAVVGDLDRVGRDVGRAYAANTVGAIAGALAAGFVVLPLLGLETGLRLAALSQAALGGALVWRATGRRRRPLVAAGVALAVGAALLSPAWNRSDFTAGLFRGHLLTGSIESGSIRERTVAFYRDGVSTTVSVEGSPVSWVLKNNGKVEASDRTDMPTQILVGLMPALVHGGSELEVFLIGYGSGVTVGAITQEPRVVRVDVAELEPAVLEAADTYFAEVSHHPADNPIVHRWIGDGRNVLIASDRHYDVIVSEPSNPWIAGVASLFTTDFYRLARQYLAPGGIFCQWAQLYELGPERVKMIYRTFHEVFPYVYAFTPGDETTDTILLGSDQPIPLDLGVLAGRMTATAEVTAELERALIESPEDLVASIFLAPDEVDSFTAGAPTNTDDNALLEHTAPRDLLASVRGNHFARAVRGPTWPYGYLDQIVSGLDAAADGDRIARRTALANALLRYGRRREATSWIERAAAGGAAPAGIARARLLLELSEPVDFRDPELVITAGTGGPLPAPSAALFHGCTPDEARTAALALTEAYRLVAEARWPAAWQRVKPLPPRIDTDAGYDVDLFMGYVAYKAITDMVLARRLLRPLYDEPGFAERRPATSYYMGRTSYGLGAFRDGINALERFVDSAPQLADEVIAKRLASGAILGPGR